MPSLWPFSRSDTSPASFEKALSRLSAQITASTVSLEKTRRRAHRSKAFWTLWSILAYLVYTAILALVLGPQQWGLPHYVGLAGAPLVIYGVKRVLTFGFDWQTRRQQGHVDRLVGERDQKIAQLKQATRYDTTQELLNKYGGTGAKPQSRDKQNTQRKTTPSKPDGPQAQHVQRTGISPPATANIPGRNKNSVQQQAHSTPSGRRGDKSGSTSSSPQPAESPTSFTDEPGFAPNAFPDVQTPTRSNPPAQLQLQSPRWYDRILDVMLGEDETLAKNRLAMICANCRLVNGQAPPGVRTLEEIGRWRCGSCGAWNGVEKLDREIGRLVREAQGTASPTTSPKQESYSPGADGDTSWTQVDQQLDTSSVPASPTLAEETASSGKSKSKSKKATKRDSPRPPSTRRKKVTEIANSTGDEDSDQGSESAADKDDDEDEDDDVSGSGLALEVEAESESVATRVSRSKRGTDKERALPRKSQI